MTTIRSNENREFDRNSQDMGRDNSNRSTTDINSQEFADNQLKDRTNRKMEGQENTRNRAEEFSSEMATQSRNRDDQDQAQSQSNQDRKSRSSQSAADSREGKSDQRRGPVGHVNNPSGHNQYTPKSELQRNKH